MRPLLNSLAIPTFVLVILCSGGAFAQPSVSHAIPSGLVPGETTEVTLFGAKLDEPVSVWTSFASQVEIVPPADGKTDATKVVCRITVPSDVRVGVGGIIVTTPTGSSDTLFTLIDDLHSMQAASDNHRLDLAQLVTLPIAIDGASPASGSSFFRFAAKAGQRLSFEVYASRLGSKFDPVLWLRDADGRELAYTDDDAGLGIDCRLAYSFAADGEYIVELRDNAYEGGQRYRLRIGNFPLVRSVFPLGGQLGASTTFNFVGCERADVEARDVTLGDEVAGRTSVGARFKDGDCSAIVPIVASEVPEAVEVEPNNELAAATQISWPCAVNGRLEEEGDQDFYQFEAKKGQRLVFKTFSRSLGSPTYAVLRVKKADGSNLAETGVTDAEEETLAVTFPEDGSYRLLVEDLLHRFGPDLTYRISIEEGVGFSLLVKHDPKKDAGGNGYKLISAGDGAFAFEVEAKRDGYDGPINLSIESSAGAFTLYNRVIAEKQTVTRLIAVPPADIKEGSFNSIRVIGQAKVGDRDVVATAGTISFLRAKWPQVIYSPDWHDGLMVLAGAKPQEAFYGVASDRDAVLLPRGIGKAEFKISPERKNGEFKDGLTVFVEGLPAAVTSAVKVNEKPPSESYQVTLTGPKDLPEGEHKIRVVSYAEFKGRGQRVVKEIPLRVVTPLSVIVAPAGPLVVGQKQKLKVSITKLTSGSSSDSQPVTIKWKGLPVGVTGPGDVTISAAVGKLELDIELTAAAGAAVGKFDGVIADAVTNFEGQEIIVESPPVSLELKPAS